MCLIGETALLKAVNRRHVSCVLTLSRYYEKLDLGHLDRGQYRIIEVADETGNPQIQLLIKLMGNAFDNVALFTTHVNICVCCSTLPR